MVKRNYTTKDIKRGSAFDPNQMMQQGYTPEMAMLLQRGRGGTRYNPFNGSGKRRKHKNKKGGYMGVPIKQFMSDLVKDNSLVQEYAPIIANAISPEYFPSKMLEKVDVKSFIKDTDFGGVAQPVALEIQEGIVDGLRKAGVGRRRRVGRPSLQSKRARARHVSAKKRNAKFAHKKVNKKRHSKK
jgi:hypothetical protein